MIGPLVLCIAIGISQFEEWSGMGAPLPVKLNQDGQAVSLDDLDWVDTGVTREDLNRTVRQWKQTLNEMWQRIFDYQYSSQQQATLIREEYYQERRKGQELLDRLAEQAAVVYRDDPSEELDEFLTTLRDRYAEHEHYELTLLVGLALIEQAPHDVINRMNLATIARFCNEFAVAAALFREVKSIAGQELLPELERFLELEPDLTAAWEAEQQLRAREAAEDRLPRVRLNTNRGEILIELFEDQAPNSVAHFLELVRAGRYNGDAFFEVSQQGYAFAGDPQQGHNHDPTDDLIIDAEFDRPDARHHYRGTVTLITRTDLRTAGSVFAICKVANPNFNGRFTAVGRVIDGQRVVDRLNNSMVLNEFGELVPVEEFVPDRILSAEVVRPPQRPLEVQRR